MGIVILQTRYKVSFNIFTERWALTLIQSIISRKPSFVQLLFDEGIISCLDDVEITEITEIFYPRITLFSLRVIGYIFSCLSARNLGGNLVKYVSGNYIFITFAVS